MTPCDAALGARDQGRGAARAVDGDREVVLLGDRLSGREVHDVLQLRSRVFVVEQHCVFLEVDGVDLQAWHGLGRDEGFTVTGPTDVSKIATLFPAIPGNRTSALVELVDAGRTRTGRPRALLS